MTSEQTEDIMCVLVVVISRMSITILQFFLMYMQLFDWFVVLQTAALNVSIVKSLILECGYE